MTDRWAEPVDQNFKNVLARDLGQLIGTDQIVHFPWYSDVKLDYKVELNVSRFDADQSGVVTLNAKWIIREARQRSGIALRGNLADAAGLQHLDSR